MPEQAISFSKIVKEAKSMFFKPKSFFASMAKQSVGNEPVKRALIFGLISALIFIVKSIVLFKGAKLWLALIVGPAVVFPLFSIAGVYVSAGILYVISQVCGGAKKFENHLWISAALMALMPLQVLFAGDLWMKPSITFVLTTVLSFYSLWITYHALISGLECKPEASRIVVVLIACLAVFVNLMAFSVNKFTRNVSINSGSDDSASVASKFRVFLKQSISKK